MAGWTSLENLLHEECIQRVDEGCDIPPALRDRIAALADLEPTERLATAETLYDALMALPDDPALATAEPNDLAAIRAASPGPMPALAAPDVATMQDRLHGAWVGRATGCALGKPVEGPCMRRDATGRNSGRAWLRAYLEARADWPLRDFVSARDVGDGQVPHLHTSCSTRDVIRYMEPDDDVHYTLMGMLALERHGTDLTWMQIARTWLERLPLSTVCTAEIQAVTNLLQRSVCARYGEATPEWTRRHRNPYREWIGAQIRADGWAYGFAGRPALAAEFAWRDAHWTHERNGIYGEMFYAAVIAAAFVEADLERLVAVGLSQIPANCRLARWVRRLMAWLPDCPTWEAAMDRVDAELGTMHPVHTINNALIVLIALHYGRGSLDDSVCIAVSCALDTDCNGATAGSIVGAIRGHAALDSQLAPRLQDRIEPSVIGLQATTFTALAERQFSLWQRLQAAPG